MDFPTWILVSWLISYHPGVDPIAVWRMPYTGEKAECDRIAADFMKHYDENHFPCISKCVTIEEAPNRKDVYPEYHRFYINPNSPLSFRGAVRRHIRK